MSAMVLVASAASSTVHAASAPPTRADEPAVGTVSADGGSLPAERFPVVETHLASGRFLGTQVPTTTTGSIPAIVLAAYQRAAERTNLVQPGCHIPLELLAAIGKVESGHARGGRVDASGRTLTPILGPVLSGGAFAAIPDTDDGEYDGDTTWDRAVGPMQFIPGTWKRWAADGNLDGQLDPHNVFDASLAAARYLCAANRDLGTPEGLDEAILSYNHSTSYLSLVRSWMSVYQNGTVPVEGLLDPGPGQADDPGTTPTQEPPDTPPSVPPSAPPSGPSTPPVTLPPPPSTPPTTPPDTPPDTPPTTDPGTPESPTPPEGAPDGLPPAPTTPTVPVDQCGLLGTIGDLLGGLLGGDPACADAQTLSTPETPETPETPAPTLTVPVVPADGAR